MTDKSADKSELETLRAEWRAALAAAREALRADEDFLDEDELRAEEHHLNEEYPAAAAELRRLALDKGLPAELAPPFLPRGLTRRALGLPARVRACVFKLDGVLVGSNPLQVEAWRRTFDELLSSRIEAMYSRHTAPFDAQIDYPASIEGRTRLDGVRTFLASRGVRLPEGSPDDPPGTETVHGVANRKNEQLDLLLEQRGVRAFDGVRHYLELARATGITCAVVSASAHTREILEQTELAELVDVLVDGETIADEHLTEEPSADWLLVACRKLEVEPEHTAVFQTNEQGIAAAHAAGFDVVVAVDADRHPAHVRGLRQAGADIVVTGLADLLERAA
ncbi:MAG TPA: HAD family hydrolase [Gaiellaceae bacterium]|nr:HAD family hydrolase [Gaiellaceae bacterium]